MKRPSVLGSFARFAAVLVALALAGCGEKELPGKMSLVIQSKKLPFSLEVTSDWEFTIGGGGSFGSLSLGVPILKVSLKDAQFIWFPSEAEFSNKLNPYIGRTWNSNDGTKWELGTQPFRVSGVMVELKVGLPDRPLVGDLKLSELHYENGTYTFRSLTPDWNSSTLILDAAKELQRGPPILDATPKFKLHGPLPDSDAKRGMEALKHLDHLILEGKIRHLDFDQLSKPKD